MKLILLPFFVMNLLCYSQISSDSINFWVKEIKEEKLDCYFDDSDPFFELAISKIKKDSLFLPQFSGDLNRTAREVLIREYDFIEESIVNGCIIESSVMCFEILMAKAISYKYGFNFLDSIAKDSKRLDSIGLGYIPAKFINDSLNIYDYLLSKGYFPNRYKEDRYSDMIMFSINEQGKPGVLEYYKEWDYYIEKNYNVKGNLVEIMDQVEKWEPAYLKGSPVCEEKTLRLFLSNFIKYD